MSGEYLFIGVGSRVKLDTDIIGTVDRVFLGPDAARYNVRWWANGELKEQTFDLCELAPLHGACWMRTEYAGTDGDEPALEDPK